MPEAINGVLWTIPLELKCYVGLGLLGLAGILRKRWAVLVLSLILVFAYAIAEPRGDHIVDFFQWTIEQRFLLEFSLFFLAGVSYFSFRIHESPKKTALVLISCLVLSAIALAASRPLLALWLVVPTVVLAAGNASTPYLRRAGRFGDASYGLYIYAFPVQQTLIWLFKNKLSWTSILFLCISTTFMLAFLSWHLVEKRALQFKPGRGKIKTKPETDVQNPRGGLERALPGVN